MRLQLSSLFHLLRSPLPRLLSLATITPFPIGNPYVDFTEGQAFSTVFSFSVFPGAPYWHPNPHSPFPP